MSGKHPSSRQDPNKDTDMAARFFLKHPEDFRSMGDQGFPGGDQGFLGVPKVFRGSQGFPRKIKENSPKVFLRWS